MCQCFVCSVSDPHQPFEGGLLFPYWKMRKGSSEKLTDMPKVTMWRWDLNPDSVIPQSLYSFHSGTTADLQSDSETTIVPSLKYVCKNFLSVWKEPRLIVFLFFKIVFKSAIMFHT